MEIRTWWYCRSMRKSTPMKQSSGLIITKPQRLPIFPKCRSIVLPRQNVDTFDISVYDHTISLDDTLKMLGLILNDKLIFKARIRNVYQTASCQINALKQISKFLNKQCWINVYKIFINAIFKYSPLVWMFLARLTWINSKNCKKEHLPLCMVTTR